MKPIDVVYVLGTGSIWNNNELRFSLRSLEKNLKGFRKVWIVGEKAEWLKNVNHIAYPDELPNNADGNIIRKVLRVCQEKGLTEDFLFINDDHLVIKPVEAAAIPPYHKGDMTSFPPAYFTVNFWRGRLFRTKNILVERGYKALHFDCHCPIVINKIKFPEVISQFNYEKNTGYTMKSLYGNVVHPDGPLLTNEKTVIFRPYVLKDIEERVKVPTFLSFNDDGLKPALKNWLYLNFPESSKYEKSGIAMEPYFEIMNWLNSPEKDFRTGMAIYDKYGTAKKVKKYLSKGESTARYMKLEHKIRELLNYV
jgi:hypothetical protein